MADELAPAPAVDEEPKATMVIGRPLASSCASRRSGLTKWPASGAATQAVGAVGPPLRVASFGGTALGAMLVWAAQGNVSTTRGAATARRRQRRDSGIT